MNMINKNKIIVLLMVVAVIIAAGFFYCRTKSSEMIRQQSNISERVMTSKGLIPRGLPREPKGSRACPGVLIPFYKDIIAAIGNKNKTKTVVINDQSFLAEVVETEDARQKGLGFRAGLCQECAMLFQFPHAGRYNFWMKDMKFGLDLLWISEGKIVQIEKNIKSDFLGVLRASFDVDYVLEINSGSVDEFNFKVGDAVSF